MVLINTIISSDNTIISKTHVAGGGVGEQVDMLAHTYTHTHTPVYCHDDQSASLQPWFPLSPHLSSLHPSHTLLLHYVSSAQSFSIVQSLFLPISLSLSPSLSLPPSVTPFFPNCLTSSFPLPHTHTHTLAPLLDSSMLAAPSG